MQVAGISSGQNVETGYQEEELLKVFKYSLKSHPYGIY